MFFRFGAIAVFTFLMVMQGWPEKAYANGFADNYTETSPPKTVPALLLKDEQGQSHNLQDFHGKFIVLNLWATWCGPCVEEMPSLDRLQSKLGGKDFVVLTMSEDHDGVAAAEAFFKRYSIKSLTPYTDAAGRAPSLVRARGLPTSLLINANGLEVGRVTGQTQWDSPESISTISLLMKANP